MAWLECHFDFGDADQFVESHISISVGVEELENGLGVFYFHVVFGLDEPELEGGYLKYSTKSWIEARPSPSGS